MNISNMMINQPQQMNNSNNMIENYRIQKLKEYDLFDQKLLQQPYLIIENNVELIEQIREVIKQILVYSIEGLGVDTLEDKNNALQKIKDKIIDLYDLD